VRGGGQGPTDFGLRISEKGGRLSLHQVYLIWCKKKKRRVARGPDAEYLLILNPFLCQRCKGRKKRQEAGEFEKDPDERYQYGTVGCNHASPRGGPLRKRSHGGSKKRREDRDPGESCHET